MGALQELNLLRKRAKELGIEKPHTMKRDQLEEAIRESEAVKMPAAGGMPTEISRAAAAQLFGPDPLAMDDEITDADTEVVIERHTHAEPLPRPAHGIVRQYAPKRPVIPNRVQVVHHTPTPIKPARRSR